MSRFIILFFLIFSYNNSFSQREISITTNGIGYSEENAIQNCIISSINEIFGVFYSSFTFIQGDSLITDDFAKINHGNIKDLKINSSEKINNEKWFVSLSLKISLDKLENFYAASSRKVNYEGGLYYYNIQLQEFNEKNEYKSVANILEVCNDILLNSFNYEFKVSDPISMDDSNDKWLVNFNVENKTNNNINLFYNLLRKNLKYLSLSDNEVNDYKKFEKKVYSIKMSDGVISEIYNLRNKISVDVLSNLFNSWEGYIRSFNINSQSKITSGNKISNYTSKELYNLKYKNNIEIFQQIINFQDTLLSINILETNLIVGNINWFETFTFNELEKISKFEVSPNYSLKIKYGGYVVYEKDGHGFVLSPFQLNKDDYKLTKHILISDFSKWNIPLLSDYELVYSNLFLNHFSNLLNHKYYLTNSRGNLGAITVSFYYNPYEPKDKEQISTHEDFNATTVRFIKRF